MSTSSAEIVNFFCHACGATVRGTAPSSIFHFTLCPRCGEGYLDDCPAAPNQAPLPAWLLRLPPPPPPWLSSAPPSAGSSSRRASASEYSSPWCPPLALLPPPPPPLLHRGEPPRGSSSPLTLRSSAASTSQQISLRPPPPPPWLLPPPPPTTLRDSWDDVTSLILIPSDEESPPRPPPPPPVSNSTDHDSTMSQAPAPPESVAALPTVAVSDAALVCPICTDGLLLLPQPAEAARQLPCGHVYHSGCIVTWLSLRNSCPVCRSSIPAMPPSAATGDAAASSSSSSASLQPEMGRRPRGRRIRRICSRLLRYMDIISRGRQANTSSSGDVRVS